MYRKSRSRASFKRSGNRSSRSRMRTVQPTQRWQRANFFVPQTTIHTAQDSYQNVVLVLAQISGHVGQTATVQGRAIDELVRYIDIGGIVFDWRMTSVPDNQIDGDFNQTFYECRMEQQLLLVTDRMDSEALQGPAAIDSNWFTNTAPVNIVASAQVDDLDQKFPTRVHWRTYRCSDDTESTRFDSPIATEPQRYRQSPNVVLAQGSKNLRLRLRLRDTECLAFHWATLASSFISDVTAAYYARCTVAGSIYYRVGF